MDFKGFYDEIIFDVDRSILKSYTGKQGDTKSRGLYVTVTQKNAVIDDLTGLSMRLFYEKPDKTRGFIDGVVDGSKFRIDYTNQMYAVPGVVKAELRLMGADGEIITAKTFKILVDSSIADGSIVSENERGILDRAFELAEDIIPRLELLDVELLEDVQAEMLGARHSGTKDATYDSLGQRLDASEQDLLDHKAEYTSNRQQDQLKVAKIEKELNDYKATMQQVNINQEPKQKAAGYGVISLPPNAAEGQFSGVKIQGLTATQLIKNGNFADGLRGWNGVANFTLEDGMLKLTTGSGFVVWQDVNIIAGHKYYISYGAISDGNAEIGAQLRQGGTTISEVITSGKTTTYSRRSGIIQATQDGDRLVFVRGTQTDNWVKIKDIMLVDLTVHGLDNKTVAELDAIFAYYFEGTKSTVSAIRIRSVSEDETQESIQYITAKNNDNKIVILNSLNNDIADTIKQNEQGEFELWKYIGAKENIANGTTIDFADMAEGGTYYAWNEDGEIETGIKGDTLGIDATTLIYQLAMPVETPVQVSGTLVSYPSGTVYVEPYVADAGIYTDKMTVLHQDLPIKVLEKLSKIDFMTGLETELDVSDAVIAEDKLSFTHPDLVDGDIVFFTYEYDRESTEGETEIEYYDSRYVIKDSVTGKFYKWYIAVADGVPSIELTEV